MNNYSRAFRDVYEFLIKWVPYPQNAAQWEKAASDANSISVQHEHNPFTTALLIAVYGELERQYKKRGQKGS